MTDFRKAILRGLETAEDLVLPRRCPICDRPVRPFGADVCPECEETVRMLSPVQDVLCCRCGRPLSDPGGEYCADCRERRHFYVRGCAAYRYREISGSIYRFKYEGRAEYARFFGRKMSVRFTEEFDPAGVDALVPVPIARERMRTRGYNQAELLAREIGAACGISVRGDILFRVRQTGAMRGMSAERRREDLKSAFNVSSDDVKSKVYVLVDDIYTTGATMDACARELMRAGASGIFCIALAIGEESGVSGKTG